MDGPGIKGSKEDVNTSAVNNIPFSLSHRSCQLNSEQVRLLLFKECDWRGRKLLFDSSTIEKVTANKNDKPNVRQADEFPCIVEVSDGCTYLVSYIVMLIVNNSYKKWNYAFGLSYSQNFYLFSTLSEGHKFDFIF